MSGGHFDYGCFKISQFANELEHEIEINDDDSKDEYGSTVGRGYNAETMARLRMAQQIIETAGKLAREVEWLYSDDSSPESFRCAYDKVIGGVDK